MSWQTIHNLGQWLEFNPDIGELRVSYQRPARMFLVELIMSGGPATGQWFRGKAETLTKAVNAAFKARDAAFKEITMINRQGGKKRGRHVDKRNARFMSAAQALKAILR